MAGDKDKASTASEDKKELAAAETTALAETGFFEGSGEGMEDFSQSDFTVPFIGILQALSKPLQKNHAKFIPGAVQGQFVNSATQQTYDGGDPGKDKSGEWNEGGLIVVPVHFEHRYVAWLPDNKGIANDYGRNPELYDSITANEKGQRLDPDGNEIVDTMQYFVLIINPVTETIEPAVVPFSKIHAKKSKRWNNLIRAKSEKHPKTGAPVKPAIYFYAYRITAIAESNEKGSWYSHNIEDYGKLPEMGQFGQAVFAAAKQLRDQVVAGEVRAAAEEPDAPAAKGDGDGAF